MTPGETVALPRTLLGWRLGPRGVLWKSHRGMIAVNPDRGPAIPGLSLILLTDGDLIGATILREWLAASPEVLILLPCSRIDAARAGGIDHDRLFALESGDLYVQNGFYVRGNGGDQSRDVDADGRHLSLSYGIEAEGLRLLHLDHTGTPHDTAEPLDAWIAPGPDLTIRLGDHAIPDRIAPDIGDGWTLGPSPLKRRGS